MTEPLHEQLQKVMEALETCGWSEENGHWFNGDLIFPALAILQSAISQVREMEWRPIVTAPRDGTDILWRGVEGGFSVIHWDTYKECFEEVGSEWMPLEQWGKT